MATGTISGVVFQDFNSNGVRDTAAVIMNAGNGQVSVAVDRGVPGVAVNVYTSTNSLAGSAVTANDGTYSINTAGSTGPYRVEFSNFPAGYKEGPFGPNSGTSVQFVPEGGAANVNLGLVIPEDYSQNNPTIAVPCYVGGDQTGRSDPVIVTFPYNAGSSRTTGDGPFPDFDAPGKGMPVTAGQVGTTWGLAWARGTRRLYASAFMKKYAGFGPNGTGAIYEINPAAPTVSLLVDLNAVFGANTAGANPHNFSDTRDNGNVTWNAVGKVSLGGLAISSDGTKLYTINLANRALYEIPTSSPSIANIRFSAVPLNAPGCPSPDDVRPFAVSYYRNQIYVGVTCTGESTTGGGTTEGNAAVLAAHVYTVDPATLTFSGTPVFSAPLNYPRGCADSAQLGLASCFPAEWKPWVPVFRNIAEDPVVLNIGPNQTPLRRTLYPQPILSSIEFDNGNLILGIRDRVGDQSGVASLDNPATNDFYYGVTAGDILRACGSPGSGWTLETNGSCGGTATAGAGNQQGPGNGEYYSGDNSPIFNHEIGMGSLLQIAGFPNVVGTVFHPIPIVPTSNDDTIFDGGVRWFGNGTGAQTKNFRIYNNELDSADVFGKANGLGDLAALTDLPPIEIGNYVWHDVNLNGIQDPDESPISGVTVQLYRAGLLIGQTTTNALGQYYFNSTNVNDGGSNRILPNTQYEIRIALAQGVLAGRTSTIADAPGSNDLNDSDSIDVAGNAVITFIIPEDGCNDHTFDFGFVVRPNEADLEVFKRAAPNCIDPGATITYTVTVTNNGPAIATNVVLTDDLPLGGFLDSVQTTQGTCQTSGDPFNCNLGSIAVGATVTITIRYSTPSNTTINSFTNRASATATEPDPNPANNSSQATSCVLRPGDPNQPIGPGDPFPTGMLSDQKPGSVLIYNFYSSSSSAPNLENTRISFTNTNVGMFVYLHLFWIDGNTCTVSDNFICLTANQTASVLASELDPGTRGYLIAVAVDADTGCPIEFNHLIGDAYVKLASGHQANLAAESIGRLPGGTAPTCSFTSSLADLVFDGAPGNYENLPRVLAASSIFNPLNGNDQLLIINAIGGDMTTGAATVPNIFGILYNDAEVSASFNIPPATCQLQRTLSNSFPRTVPNFTDHIGAGRTGWMKFWAASESALLGAIINYNPNAFSDAGSFNQGRNLHKLTYTPTTTITIPVFSPSA